ncbi:MAG TPA: ABC transporter ATP-binding protein [Methylomirabilota bacterium]|nr:ABC transporter ATP-binding protein [Methylomirabilota bacterium]
MNNRVVETHDLFKQYRMGKTTVEAIRGVSLAVARGEFFAIAGPSGSGKTTLLNLIGCLDTPSSGEIEIDGEAVGQLSSGARADLRARKIGFIFQTFNLIPVLTAYENVEYPLFLGRRTGDRRSQVETALAQVGLADRARHRPTELSGGQQQRVAVARALVTDPSIVLADEPTANLDSKTGHEIIELMHRLNRERGTTFIFSTHDPRIMKAADRVVEISDGQLLTQGV